MQCQMFYTYISFLKTSALNAPTITEEYISTLNPSAFARVFGRAMPNTCANVNVPDGIGGTIF